MSTARRRLKSPQSLSDTSAHHTMATLVNIMVMNDDSHPFRSMSISRPIAEIKLFQNLTLKFQLQGQVMGVVEGQGHTIGPVSYQLTSFSFHMNQTNNSWDRAVSKFDIETSKVKVLSDVKGYGHILYPVSNWCTSFSFHINRTNHSWDMAKIVCDLEKAHPKFRRKFAKIGVSNRTSPKSNQVITITRAIKLSRYVGIRWVVFTLSRRQANFCSLMPQPWP